MQNRTSDVQGAKQTAFLPAGANSAARNVAPPFGGVPEF